MKDNNLLIILSFLIVADFITTFIGVQHMGAIELNPLYKYCDNLEQWLTIKYFAGIVCLTALAVIEDTNEKVVTIGLTILTILYFIVVLSNLIQIVINI